MTTTHHGWGQCSNMPCVPSGEHRMRASLSPQPQFIAAISVVMLAAVLPLQQISFIRKGESAAGSSRSCVVAPCMAYGRVTPNAPEHRMRTTTFLRDANTTSVTDVYVHPVTRDVYACAAGSHTIIRIVNAPSVVLSSNVVAGSKGNGGFADGIGSTARFKTPFGVAGDGADMLYIGDQQNHRIRSINISGGVFNVSTVAGSGTVGFSDGAGVQASFNWPCGVALASNNTMLYVADFFNSAVRRVVLATKNVSTVCSSATMASPPFKGPVFLAVSHDEVSLYVSLAGSNYVAQVNLSSSTPLAVNNVTGITILSPDALLDDPYGTRGFSCVATPYGLLLSPDNKMLVISGENSNLIHVMGRSAGVGTKMITVAGNGTAGYVDYNQSTAWSSYPSASLMSEPSVALFNRPQGMAWWAAGGGEWTFLVADRFNNAIRSVTLESTNFDPFPPPQLYGSPHVASAPVNYLSHLYTHPTSGIIYAVYIQSSVVTVSMAVDGVGISRISAVPTGGATINGLAGDGLDCLYAISNSLLAQINVTSKATNTFSLAQPDCGAVAAVAAGSSTFVFAACGSSIYSVTLKGTPLVQMASLYNLSGGLNASGLLIRSDSKLSPNMSMFVSSSGNTILCLDLTSVGSAVVVTRSIVVAGSTTSVTTDGFNTAATFVAPTDLVLMGDVLGWPCLYVKDDSISGSSTIREVRLHDQYVRTITTLTMSNTYRGGMTSYCNATTGEFGLLVSGDYGHLYVVPLGNGSDCGHAIRFTPTDTTPTTATATDNVTVTTTMTGTTTYSMSSRSPPLLVTTSPVSTTTTASVSLSCQAAFLLKVRSTACPHTLLVTPAYCVELKNTTDAYQQQQQGEEWVGNFTAVALPHVPMPPIPSLTIVIPSSLHVSTGWTLHNTTSATRVDAVANYTTLPGALILVNITHTMTPPKYGELTTIHLLGVCWSGGMAVNVTIHIQWPQRTLTASSTIPPLPSHSATTSATSLTTSKSSITALRLTPPSLTAAQLDKPVASSISPASDGLVSSAALLTLFSGGAASSISVVMLSLMQCSQHPPVSTATYVVSVFFDIGTPAMAIGNVGLAVVVFLLQFGIVQALHVSTGASRDNARAVDHGGVASSAALQVWVDRRLPFMCRSRCPALGVKVLGLLLPGSVLGITAGLIHPDAFMSPASAVALCVVALMLVLGLLGVYVWVVRRVALPRATFVPYRRYTIGTVCEQRFLFPTARWEPVEVNVAFSALISSMGDGYTMLLFAELLHACFIGLVSGTYVGGVCASSLLGVASALYYGYCIVLVVYRPHRMPVDRACAPVVHFLLGTLCAMQCADDDSSSGVVGEALQIIVSLLQLTRSITNLFVSVARERYLRDDNSCGGGENVDDASTKQMETQLLPKDEQLLPPLLVEDQQLPEEVLQANPDATPDGGDMIVAVPDEAYAESLLPHLLLLDDTQFWDEQGNAVAATWSGDSGPVPLHQSMFEAYVGNHHDDSGTT